MPYRPELDHDVGGGAQRLQRVAIEGVGLHELHALGDAERLGVAAGRGQRLGVGVGDDGAGVRLAGQRREQVRRRPGGEVGDDGLRAGLGAQRVEHRALGQRADVAEGDARAPAQQPAVDRAADDRAARGPVGVDVGHEGARVEAVAVADAQAVAQQRPGARARAQRGEAPGARRDRRQLALQVGEARQRGLSRHARSAGSRPARGRGRARAPRRPGARRRPR